ncbi:hypothetical protein CDG77_01580 [Nostoc sp. 'Peltigera membranacea cyanobiont' 213]|uniref:hypothetical protein n=1 Tax=unclassified Nostoc TaxID=2593658 RepID=UPI000B952316|nr:MULTISPECIES: hypothetical protein [unclassified Nostoc]AVH67359.1 hypothetical protein NPM_5947 [Nostoc sp. 'Peltigera membranacea cyanobiont' N6]OYD99383.1 hypothetical protein CDG77_01580 [Nostoc sp. 'Peltigera membranacea cyanobiont' 213]
MLEIPPEIENQIKRWHRDAVILHSIFITLGVTSILSSLIVATFVEELGNFRTKVFAAISAGSVGIINTTGVGRKGNGFRQAQRHLKAETIRFSAGKSSIEDLAKAFAEAESMIGDVEIKIRDSSNS